MSKLSCLAVLSFLTVLMLASEASAGPNEDVITASKAGDKAGVEAALGQGASVNAVDPLGAPGQTTPLGIAAAGGHANVAELLLDRGANVNGVDNLGQSPLHMAAEHGSNVVAKLLLDRGANIDARDFLGATPLQYASLDGQKSVVELLTIRGATVNAQSSFGKTALHLAAAAGNKEVVKVLLAHGAGVTVRNSDHQTPLQELQASSLDTATKTNIAALLNAPRNATARNGSQTARQNPLRPPVNPQASTPNALPACTDLAGISALVSRANPGIDPRVLVSAVEQYQVTMGCRQPPPTVALPPPSPPPPSPTTTNCTTSGYDSGGIVNRTTNCTTR
jgi:hypothetical protein